MSFTNASGQNVRLENKSAILSASQEFPRRVRMTALYDSHSRPIVAFLSSPLSHTPNRSNTCHCERAQELQGDWGGDLWNFFLYYHYTQISRSVKWQIVCIAISTEEVLLGSLTSYLNFLKIGIPWYRRLPYHQPIQRPPKVGRRHNASSSRARLPFERGSERR